MELKACPFCGGKAIIDDCGDHRYFVRCTKCSINQDKLFAQKCDAAKVWNRRAIADVAPIKHAKWIDKSSKKLIFGRVLRDRIVQCDQCRNYLDMDGVNGGRGDANYCPNCGARMDAKS